MSETALALRISDLMALSGVGFGTSGARGLATDMTDRVCYAYTTAFLQYLRQQSELRKGSEVAIAGDYRPSTPRIMAACARAIGDLGYTTINCGAIPTPAVANYGMQQAIPSLMVTGSHIPDDRNGIKFYRAHGEILKDDEAALGRQSLSLRAGLFTSAGALVEPDPGLPAYDNRALDSYIRRFLDFFPARSLEGIHIGLYEHSSVAHQAFYDILSGLGASVTPLGRSERFVPVDTEAIRPEDVRLAARWAAEGNFDCILSTDGDGDRPLISDEKGRWLRGDIAGILCARYLGANTIVTPVSSNTAVEKCAWFERITRTRIGSPYVIEAMNQAAAENKHPVVGYEANGGFLTASTIRLFDRSLPALPTRDAAIVALGVILLAQESAKPISALMELLPARFTTSDRLKNFPTAMSAGRIAMLNTGEFTTDKTRIEALFGEHLGRVKSVDDTDGLRITFENDDIIHLRPSGNAPELRCYTEAGSIARAEQINQICMHVLNGWRED